MNASFSGSGILRALLCVLFAAASFHGLSGCMHDDGPSTETGNPNISGTLRDASGEPAAGTVKLFRLPAPAPAGSIDSTALIAPVLLKILSIKADGRYRFDSLPPGGFALEGIDAAGTRFALARDLALAGPKERVRRDLAVKSPGRVRGRVTRGNDARPPGIAGDEGILVRLSGADRSATTDASGGYTLDNVPEGAYRVAFAAADGHYLPRFFDSAFVVSGEDLELHQVNLEWSPFIAPPPPLGVKAAADSAAASAAGTVRVEWRAVRIAGDGLDHYVVVRADSGNAGDTREFLTQDTAFIDTIKALPPGRSLRYTVRAVNSLGQAGPAAGTNGPIVVPVPKDTIVTGAGSLQALVLLAGSPAPGARVLLYGAPGSPGLPGTPPKAVKLLDSAVGDAQGLVLLRELPAGRYTLYARTAAGLGAISAGVTPMLPAGPLRTDTLALALPGSVEGYATRSGFWVSTPLKGDENIRASLADAPFATLTDYGSPPQGARFRLTDVPPGAYRLVVSAPPDSYFVADTLEIAVRAGAVTTLAAPVECAYNPDAPPPKASNLRITASARNKVSLAWDFAARYPALKGFRVLRLDSNLRATDSSAVSGAASYEDDISGIPAGTLIRYVVRVAALSGREGAQTGDAGGNAVPFTVPGP
ncbi:MAG: hypothetical protein JWP91_3149 [Fibrobacteres bacterium]|nr:hypothetical protein [Fibrobacterota bacterium]